MGIRTLNHRPAVVRADIGEVPAEPPPSVPPFAADANTARVPTGLTTPLCRAARHLRRRLTPGGPAPGATPPWWLWADVARGYLALLLAHLPRPGPARHVTVFVATVTPAPVSDRSAGPPPHRPGQDRGHRQGPEPDATP
ncbi:hypothetical protein [Streptomyces triticisoli]|jgi:hypothetical protein|uniref:hypothetical protein n=1 Tax=Streptomyces triticisoli TaxID=2182797 RepID=UPI0013007C3D|nr:hypothetical protein [Streptomyces triticisoli]